MRSLRSLAATAILGAVVLSVAEPATARTYDNWDSVTTRLSGVQTPWEPDRDLGLTLDRTQRIDVAKCPRSSGVAIRTKHSSPSGKRAFWVLQQPNRVTCVKVNNRGFGRVATIRHLGYTFDVYARCGRSRCPKSSLPKGGLVRSRAFPKGATLSSVRIATKGLTFAQVAWITNGLTPASFN